MNLVGILVDIHQLNEYIEQGDVDKATKLFKQLASQGIQFQAKISEKLPNDNMFPYVMNSSSLWFFISRLLIHSIRVRIDDKISRTSDREEQLVLNVYKSTTIRELRAAVSRKKTEFML